MMPKEQMALLKLLLMGNKGGIKLWAAFIALAAGVAMLLASVLIWWDFRQLLYGNSQGDSLGSTYVVVSKKVTEQNMGVAGATVFSNAELAKLSQAPQVQELGQITGARFRIWATMGGQMSMSTDLPLETAPDRFLDKLPTDWHWEPGSRDLPIIISSQFLDIYNYAFAPSQGLPQLSQTAVKSVALQIKIGNSGNEETYSARVVGFSDRIGSVLVPQSFIEYGNKKFGAPGAQDGISQVILKTDDPSDPKFAAYLEEHGYTTQSQNLRWSKMRGIVAIISAGIGLVALLITGIGTLVFVLFIELTVVKASSSLQLLLQLGYSPRSLQLFMVRRFVPFVLGPFFFAAKATFSLQVALCYYLSTQGMQLSVIPGWPVWLVWCIAVSSLLLVLLGAIKKYIQPASS